MLHLAVLGALLLTLKRATLFNVFPFIPPPPKLLVPSCFSYILYFFPFEVYNIALTRSSLTLLSLIYVFFNLSIIAYSLFSNSFMTLSALFILDISLIILCSCTTLLSPSFYYLYFSICSYILISSSFTLFLFSLFSNIIIS